MRFIAGLALLASALSVHAATLDVSVVAGSNEPQKFSFAVSDRREHIDLRETHSYPAAFTDTATKKDICRDGLYQTGLLLTLRPVEAAAKDEVAVEIIGQVSTLTALKPGAALSCGTDYKPVMAHSALSDSVSLKKKRTKVIVIDSKYTILVTLR